MNYLVTGGAGFIGSNFLNKFIPLNPKINFINVDKMTYAADNSNLSMKEFPNYTFYEADIADERIIRNIIQETNPKKIIHFAAESHVDQSIANPKKFIESNITGTFNLLEAAKNIWDNYDDKQFHHVSTDEVYGSLGKEGFFTESTSYAPRSPYSASKAASDHLVRAYFSTFGLPVTITNCSNNYGPNQHGEKLIPTIIKNALRNNPIPIYGSGNNIRDWLFVEDHCDAIWRVIHEPKTIGQTYNVGGNNEISNLTIVNKVLIELSKQTGASIESYGELIQFVEDRKGHDFRYAIDSSKIKLELGWQPKYNFEKGLEKTVSYYVKKYSEEGK